MKVGKACSQCRASKRKCHKPEPGAGCKECLRRNIHCSGQMKIRHGRQLAPQHDLSSIEKKEEHQSLPKAEIIEELVGLYLKFVHDKPHALFHVPTLWRDVQSSTISNALVLGILGLSARFSESPAIQSKGFDFGREARRLLLVGLEKVCLETIQTCVIVGNICGVEGDAGSECLFFGIAIRMAQIMHLSHPDPMDSIIVRQTKIRVWWTLYMVDRWSSAGLALPRQIHDYEKPPELPVDEHDFHNISVDSQDIGPQKLGLWAYMVTLVDVFGPIQDLNRALVQIDSKDQLLNQTIDFEQQLETWKQSLPPELMLSEENLQYHRTRGVGRSFVALHLGFYHYSTLLYFQYLDTRSSITIHGDYAARCKENASAFSDLLRLSHDTEGCDAVYMIVSHMTVVSSSVLLHTLILGDESELPEARRRLVSNFDILVKMKRFWPRVEAMMKRLYYFQNMCMHSTDSHKMDNWMLKFLLEHALPLDEKENFISTPTESQFNDPSETRELMDRYQFTNQALSQQFRLDSFT